MFQSAHAAGRDAAAARIDAAWTGDVMPLSDRERTILTHLMEGASNKHIARELNIAEATVKVHVKNLLGKIRVKNRTQAAMWGMKLRPAEWPSEAASGCLLHRGR